MLYFIYRPRHTKNVSLHRLLCLTFKPIKNPNELTVDHKDGDINNNSLDNLEWVTLQENIRRWKKYGKSRKHEPIPVTIRNYITGEDKEFPTTRKAANYLNVSEREVRRRLLLTFGRIFRDLTVIKFSSDKREFPNYTFEEACDVRHMIHNVNPVKAYNHFTNEEKVFDQTQHFAKYVGCSQAVASTILTKNRIWNGWELKLIYDKTPFKKFSKYELFRLKCRNAYSYETPIVVNDNGEYKVYSNQKECCGAYNIGETTLGERLKRIIWTEKDNVKYAKLDKIPDDELENIMEKATLVK